MPYHSVILHLPRAFRFNRHAGLQGNEDVGGCYPRRMKMLAATPALPVRDVPSAVAFYRDRLGFEARHVAGGFAIMQRDDIEIHLWEANAPDIPGAEPHLAGSASCRVKVEGLHGLYDEYRAQDVIHPNGALTAQPWGVEDFTVLDLDNNAIGFFESVPHR